MLHYQEEGAGEAVVVLLHGFLGSGRNLGSLARGWSQRRPGTRLLAFDLPGHGRSPGLTPGAGMADLAGAVLASLDELGVAGPVEVAGHSLGGRVALRVAEAAPARVRSVSLLDISPGPVPPQDDIQGVVAALMAAPAQAADRAAMRERLLGEGISRPLADWLLMNLEREADGAVAWRIDRESLAEAHGRWGAEDLWPVVEGGAASVRCCIRGGRSGFVTPADVARLQAAGVSVYTLEGAGHFVHAEALDPLLAVLVPGPGVS